MTRQIHKTPPILKLTHNFEARVCNLYLWSLKGKVVHWTLTLSQDLQVFMSQCTPPIFPFTSALPISFNKPGLFGRGEKSNAKYRGTYAQIFHRVGLFVFFIFIILFLIIRGREENANFRGTYAQFFFFRNIRVDQ